MEAAVIFELVKSFFFFQKAFYVVSKIDRSRSKKKDFEKSALLTTKGSIMALNPCNGNMRDSAIQVDPSLRNNICFLQDDVLPLHIW